MALAPPLSRTAPPLLKAPCGPRRGPVSAFSTPRGYPPGYNRWLSNGRPWAAFFWAGASGILGAAVTVTPAPKRGVWSRCHVAAAPRRGVQGAISTLRTLASGGRFSAPQAIGLRCVRGRRMPDERQNTNWGAAQNDGQVTTCDCRRAPRLSACNINDYPPCPTTAVALAVRCGPTAPPGRRHLSR